MEVRTFKRSFDNHFTYLKKKCLKALNLLRVMGHTDWGADRATLLKLYRTLVRSKLDYGSVVYGSAKKHGSEGPGPYTSSGLSYCPRGFQNVIYQKLVRRG
ncbi:RNA-directed DNA polymerase from mobile element jockey [Plakobranchus ocellatus]|uniref:RNA-directed DNA polymerase from mobile element jockey n=1 Tax=Plakobranchus ocellatus TaxID=259542 RepID=A0AAV4C2S1_9GAST|nr:RNA-directed DNA polymerase from mobile element jockey [Plakobranchus ocellatus]